MPQRNELPRVTLPSRNEFRDAVNSIVCNVQRDFDLNDEEMADAVGVSEGTIRNARNRKADLHGLTIACIGKKFGERYIDPYMALLAARATPMAVADTPDPMPALMALAHLIAANGGLRNHQDYLGALPAIDQVYAAVSALRTHAMGLTS